MKHLEYSELMPHLADTRTLAVEALVGTKIIVSFQIRASKFHATA